MRKITFWLCLVILVFCSISCNTTDSTEVQKDVEKWMSGMCGRCHEKNEYTHLLQLTSKMETNEFQDILHGMVHGNIKLTESEIQTAIDYFQKKHLLKEERQSGENT